MTLTYHIILLNVGCRDNLIMCILIVYTHELVHLNFALEPQTQSPCLLVVVVVVEYLYSASRSASIAQSTVSKH